MRNSRDTEFGELVPAWDPGRNKLSKHGKQGSASAPGGPGRPPLAVLPALQRPAIGSHLVSEGLSACGDGGVAFIVVLAIPLSTAGLASDRAWNTGFDGSWTMAMSSWRWSSGGQPRSVCGDSEPFAGLYGVGGLSDVVARTACYRVPTSER